MADLDGDARGEWTLASVAPGLEEKTNLKLINLNSCRFGGHIFMLPSQILDSFAWFL